MNLAVIDLIAIIMTLAGLVSALSVMYAKFIKPIKRVIRQVEENEKRIKSLDEKIAEVRSERAVDNAFDVEVRSILLESLIAVLDGLEQSGANHLVTEQKQKLITFLTKQV